MRSTHRKAPKSDNVYLKLLVKLYRFLARKSNLLSSALPHLIAMWALMQLF